MKYFTDDETGDKYEIDLERTSTNIHGYIGIRPVAEPKWEVELDFNNVQASSIHIKLDVESIYQAGLIEEAIGVVMQYIHRPYQNNDTNMFLLPVIDEARKSLQKGQL